MTDPKRILVVDDEYSSTEVLAFVLGEEGYRVSMAADGRQALASLDDARPDLIITDYMMPFMNGLALAEAVRARPDHGSVRILLMSGVPESRLPEPRDRYDLFLRKPFTMDALLDAVRTLLA